MKKILILILMTISLSGCKMIKDESEQIVESMNRYNNGIYETKVNGYGGEFSISVTYENDKIVNVTIGDNNETPSIGGVAAMQIAKNVEEQNTVNLDIISGATITSEAVYKGLQELEKKALK